MKKTIQNFRQYKSSPAEYSTYKNIHISLLEDFKSKFGSQFRIRYRGPRVGMGDGRSKIRCQQDCIKQNAFTFSAYRK